MGVKGGRSVLSYGINSHPSPRLRIESGRDVAVQCKQGGVGGGDEARRMAALQGGWLSIVWVNDT